MWHSSAITEHGWVAASVTVVAAAATAAVASAVAAATALWYSVSINYENTWFSLFVGKL